MKIGMMVQNDIIGDLASSFLGSHTCSASTCAGSAHSELCEHCYSARREGGR